MPDVTIRPLSGPDELTTFNRLRYVLDDQYAQDLDDRRRRPQWMWVALRGDHLVARAAWWGWAGAEEPLLMDVFDLDPDEPDRHRIAADLIRTALSAMKISETPPEYLRFLPAGWRHDPKQVALVADRTGVLEHLGGRLLVERLRLRWGPDAVVPARRPGLTFRPPADRGELLDLLTRTLVGTLDEHSRDELRTRSLHDVAVEQLDDEFPNYRGPRDLWAVGCLADGEPVGFVIPSANDYGWIIAYIGVLPEHRGHRYIDDLLDHGTRVLAAAGATTIKASTDLGNVPMADAFHRCGYPTVEEEIDYTFAPPAGQ